MIKFEINQKVKLEINPTCLKLIASSFSELSGQRGNISLAIIGDAEMRRLNFIWRGQDKTTDILSFEESKGDFILGGDNIEIGEIIISAPQLKRQAKKFQKTVQEELSRLLIHGCAHLIGLDHECVSNYKIREMEAFEKKMADLLLLKKAKLRQKTSVEH